MANRNGRPQADPEFDLTEEDSLRIAEENGVVFLGDPVMEALHSRIFAMRLVPCIKTVVGPPGSGKEGIARHIHHISCFRDGTFVPVNCGSLADDITGSEMMGHERGAFTGADRQSGGACERAQGGTLFLDEIGDLSRRGQAALLRLLENGEVRRVGNAESIPFRGGIICATNLLLENLRDDFYTRISACVFKVPAFESRDEAHKKKVVLALAERSQTGIEGRAVDYLLQAQQGREGNVRWLENRIKIAAGLARARNSPSIQHTDVEFSVRMYFESKQGPECEVTDAKITIDPRSFEAGNVSASAIRQLEIHLIKWALKARDGNKTHAAMLLGINRNTLLDRLKGLDLSPDAVD